MMYLEIIWALAFIVSAAVLIGTLSRRLVRPDTSARTEKAGSIFLFVYGAGTAGLDNATAGYIAAVIGAIWFLYLVFLEKATDQPETIDR
mgnify:CR=1 FL=1